MHRIYLLAVAVLVACTCCVKIETLDEIPAFTEINPVYGVNADFEGKTYQSWIELDGVLYKAELAYIQGTDVEAASVVGDIKCLSSYLSSEKELISERQENGVTIALYRMQYIVKFDLYELPLYFEKEEVYVKQGDDTYHFYTPKTTFAPVEVSYEEFYIEENEDSAFSIGEITVSVTAKTAGKTAKAVTKAAIRSRMEEIFFDPSVDPWK